MKEWQFIRNEQEFYKLKEEARYEGASPIKYPCIACPRGSTNPATRINLAYPIFGELSRFLNMDLEKIERY